ncbi:carbohydrate binding domain-containing protein [Streptomyces sp. HP-A2021]|uniref:carbohydrate binding domain-containing protein n=1 Tax=Streptomyces sp. HP-A2021 TaxID=2927875 RepID=UPI001FAF6A7C|nr:carbohydrate binding domain-containing protein [Streptomyces sp. HP-A2021]UOB09061.1 carbohydrate binding domain-containing protein [Streptomyces sp. HP-A2021]
MVFPETPLPIKAELRLGSTWTDVTADVRAEQQIRIRRGRSDWGQQVDTSTCTFTLDNNDGRYTPRNPNGPYYGQIGRNTAVRVSVMTGETYLDLPGASTGDYAETPDAAALDVTGDLDVRLDMSLANWLAPVTSGATVEMIGKFGFTGQKSWFVGTRSGRLFFEWSADGTNSLSASSTIAPVIPGPGGRMALRVTLDVDNGSGGNTVRFYTAPTIDGPWVQVGDPVTQSGTTSIFNSTANLRIGNATSFTFNLPLGRCHAAEVRNGINGTVVAAPDFTAQAVGTVSFADSAGRTWTMNGNAQITNRRTRFVGEVSAWNTRWETKHDVVTHVEASGIMRRLSQGASPVRSPMYREFTNASRSGIVSYWPMEDESGATRFASGMDGQPAMTIPSSGGVTPAAYSGWAASAPLPTYSFGTTRVAIAPYTATNYIFTRFFAAVPAAGVTSTDRLFTIVTTGSARTWAVWINAAGDLDLRAYDSDGTQILATGFDPVAINGKNVQIGVELTQNGANVDATLYVFYVDESSLNRIVSDGVATTLAANTIGAATECRFGFNGLLNGTALGHLAVASSNTAYTNTIGAMIGWDGEVTSARLYRLGTEELTPCFSASISEEQMGVQGLSPLLDLMREAADADEGILHESRDWYPAFRFRDRPSMYSQAPAMVLDYTGDDGLVTPLDPVDDDQAVRNDRTVQRTGGSSTRRTLDEGALSTQVPPDGVGRYDDSQTRSLYEDAQTGDHAGWLLHLGTWDETRYPVVRLNLAAAPHMIEAATSVDIGDRMDIANPPSWLPPDLIELMAQGYSEVLDQFTWTLDFNCTPFGPWDVAWAGDASTASVEREFQWVDTDGSQLAEALTTSETDVDVLTTTGPVWTPNVRDTPFDWRIGGEVMTVTAPGGLLNSNAFFDTDTTGWTAQSCTIAHATTVVNPHPRAAASLLVTPNGVAAVGGALCTQTAVDSITPGAQYTASMWVYSPGGWSELRPAVNWHDSAGTFLSSSFGSASAVSAGVWTYLEQTFTAPALASRAVVRAHHSGTPASSDVYYVWAVRVTRTSSSWLYDQFGRTAASSWGTADSGQTWSTGGGTAADYNVTGGYGAHRLATVNASRRTLVDFPYADFDAYVSLTPSATATGGFLSGGLAGRYTDSDNLYTARIAFNTTGTMTLTIRKRVAAVETELVSYTLSGTYTAGTFMRMRFQVSGSTLRAKAWPAAGLEPGVWQAETTDTALTTSAFIGLRSISASSNSNVNPEVRYDQLDLVNPQTYTVTRSVNGVSKTHTAGAAVALAHPAYTSL